MNLNRRQLLTLAPAALGIALLGVTTGRTQSATPNQTAAPRELPPLTVRMRLDVEDLSDGRKRIVQRYIIGSGSTARRVSREEALAHAYRVRQSRAYWM